MAENVVLVTGGGRGIGRAVCVRLARAGSQIVAVSRTVGELNETKASVERAGGRCHIQPADVGVQDAVRSLVDEVVQRFGCIDTLVNCAGIAPRCAIEELTTDLFEKILAVNVRSTYLTCRAVWPVMKAKGGGVIVNVSSIASVDPFAGFAAYGAAKAWVNAWTHGLAEEGRSCGIRVFAVAPGAVETRMLRDPFPDFPKRDTLDPDHVADVVHVVTQAACRYATGQTIFVRRQGD
jgi:NAD(P)-dependent dehydrogenase (short-subunit alcohol dehydrogenase family)